MTTRFYEVTLLDAVGAPRALAIDLLAREPSDDPAAHVRSIATTVRGLDTHVRARTSYVAVPTQDASVQPLSAYVWGDGAANSARLRRHLDTLHRTGTIHRFDLRTGSWAEGADLVGRHDILASLRTKLTSGMRVHLMAPRRYGKTSIVRALHERLVEDGRVVVRLDVESVDTIAGLVVRLVDETFQVSPALREIQELRGWPQPDAHVLVLAEACRALQEATRAAPMPLLQQVCAVLARAGVVLLIDEFTRFILEATQTEGQASLVRALEALAATPGLMILVCGSQGLRGFIEWHELHPLRALERVAVEPLDSEVASVLVEELFYGARHAPTLDAIAAVLEAIGAPIPYFLHGLVHHTLQERRRPGSGARKVVDRTTVVRAYERRLLDQEGNEFFRPFRLKERGYPDAIRDAAATVLRMLASTADVLSLEALRAASGLPPATFELLMAALGEDYDVVRDEDGARLRSKVMRERWARREAWLRGGGQ